MPEEAVIEAPAVEATAEPTATPAQPRDSLGRFLSPGETVDGIEGGREPDAPAAETVETPEAKAATPEAQTTAQAGLTLDDDVAPVYGHDGKFVGGKLFGKYETIDEQIIAHKNAMKRIGQLEYELSQRDNGEGEAKANPISVPDPEFLTPEQLESMVDQSLGEQEEMTLEQRIEFEENPARYLAKENAKRESIREQIRTKAQDTVAATKAAYAKVWDTAQPHGMRVWNDVLKGKMPLPEVRVLLGLGLLAREGLLSSNEPVTKRSPVGGAPEKKAAVSAPVKTKPAISEEDMMLEIGRKAAYGG